MKGLHNFLCRSNLFLCRKSIRFSLHLPSFALPTELTRNIPFIQEYPRGKLSHRAGPLSCVGIELSSRDASVQVFSPLRSLTSVFGMGTGGPSAFATPTSCSH